MHDIDAVIFKINCKFISNFPATINAERGSNTYKPLEVFGPEHEFSLVNEELRPLPIVDKVIKDFRGRIVNFVEQTNFSFGKELQLHVMEVKPNTPFLSPIDFDEVMHKAVLFISEYLRSKHNAFLLGTGMHPLLRLEETGVWPHRHKQIYEVYGKIFNLKQHGWLNIQSFQLNLPYANEKNGILLHNLLANISAYLPAISASSPFYEGNFGEYVDNRLYFYKINQKEVPSITGNVIPEYIHSFAHYKKEVIQKYSRDLVEKGTATLLANKDWVNSRGVIFRFDRRAIEVRVMDEQECIRSDVALSCFIRALLRGFLKGEAELLPHRTLVNDFNAVIKHGLNAKVSHPLGSTARHVCKYLLKTAWENASEEERKYLPIIEKRIELGNLSEIIKNHVLRKTQKTNLKEAIISVYSNLMKNLINNEPYS